MKIGIVGLDFNSGNKGCEALAYAFLEILNNIGIDNNDKINVYLLQKFPIKLFLKNNLSTKKVYEYYKPKKEFSNLNINFIMIHHTSKEMFYNNKISKMDCVIDFTSGDSFSDIYGVDRFMTRTKFKEKIINHNIPLILGSQTIGPFENKDVLNYAAKIIEKSEKVFARDQLSFDCVKKICNVEPILTTDVAFALPYKKVDVGNVNKIKVGFNPSGLLWNGGYSGNNQFNLKVNYKEYCKGLMEKLLKSSNYEVHLIVHSFENNDVNISDNDLVPAKELHELYPETILSPLFDSCIDAKNYISSMDVFIGARMHATIAAYSSYVPVIPFSYSRKFEGLFSSLNYKFVLNTKEINTDECIEQTMKLINNRNELKETIIQGHKDVDEKIKIFKSEMEKILYKNDIRRIL